MAQSSIEWTESTWNPLTGCTKISPGCKHCYAERMAKRLQGMGQPRYANGFVLALHDDVLRLPLSWKKPNVALASTIGWFASSMMPTANRFGPTTSSEVATTSVGPDGFAGGAACPDAGGGCGACWAAGWPVPQPASASVARMPPAPLSNARRLDGRMSGRMMERMMGRS